MKYYDINILRLKNTPRKFNFELNKEFFSLYEFNFIKAGKVKAEVLLIEETKNNLLKMKFHLEGDIELECDRSLEKFLYPINIDKEVIFEFGDKDEEINVDHYVINKEATYINIAQHLHDFIVLEAPIKKLHPKYTTSI
ncbi:MAG: DUF177 domain-containing protein [Bacteroidetes bacterium]|nr:DUF177 domain-containing protein [Bacteroidota bacterium]